MGCLLWVASGGLVVAQAQEGGGEAKPKKKDDPRYKKFIRKGSDEKKAQTAEPEAEPKQEAPAESKAEPAKEEKSDVESIPVETQKEKETAEEVIREDPNEPELVDLYSEEWNEKDDSIIEGAVGWKHNRVPKTALEDGMLPVPDRWRIGLPRNTMRKKGSLINPYRQNILKGDYPIIGQQTFLNVIAASDTLVEGRNLPIPSGVTSSKPRSFEFFGSGELLTVNQNFILSVELFGGETEFKPRDWEVRVAPVFNINYLKANEQFVVNIDPTQGTDRHDHQIAFQELFGEYHFYDLTKNYDLIAGRFGIQPLNMDFRGFLFFDDNLGARVLGTYENFRLQYNLAYFNMLNKDTNSGLNNLFELKDEHVLLANVIRQDTMIKGYDIMATVGFSSEEESQRYNENGVLVRPAPIGSLQPHAVKAGYIGFGGNGHIGRWNITHQFYQVFGNDTLNPIAGKEVSINAQMAAVELSVDMDWMRPRISYFYASGDNDALDNKATGFDAIIDNPDFAGGQFSYWVRQGFIPGNAVTLMKDRFSLLPNLATSKGEGQANFVNPGLHLFNIGYDAELLPHLKAILNANYLEFASTEPLEKLLNVQGLSKKIGYDVSMGLQYRPLLNNNIILNFGVAGLIPAKGFQQLYESRKTRWHAFTGITLTY